MSVANPLYRRHSSRRMSEAELEEFFVKRVRLLGWMTIKVAPVTAGAPDRMLLLPGGGIRLIELKTEVGRLSKVQEEWHRKARELGTTVVVIFGPDHLLKYLSRLVENQAPRPGRPGRPSNAKAIAKRIEEDCVALGHTGDCCCAFAIESVMPSTAARPHQPLDICDFRDFI